MMFTQRLRAIVLVTLALLVPIAAARASVIVVDAGGGGQYVQISFAVAAAASGDTVLVKSGAYDAFTIDGKSLSVVADDGASVVINGSIGVRHITAAQTVVVSGLTSAHTSTSGNSSDPTFGAGLFVLDALGPVRLETCQLEGMFGTNTNCWSESTAGRPGVYVGASTSVAIVGCTLLGGNGGGHEAQCWCGSNGGAGGRALFSNASTVALYDCVLIGGNGGRGAETGGRGGDGADVVAGHGVFASHCSFAGGVGGTADAGPSDPSHLCVVGTGGAGGYGLNVAPGEPVTSAQLVGGSFTGGAGGVPLFGGDTGAAGGGVSGIHVTTLAGPPRVLSAPSVARASTSIPLSFYGQPGDEVYLRIARQTGFHFIAQWNGVLITHNPHPEYVAILGTIPASGVLSTAFDVGALPSGVDAQSLFLQAQMKNPQGTTWLASFAAVTVLDSAF
jgi:hypothetical protein